MLKPGDVVRLRRNPTKGGSWCGWLLEDFGLGPFLFVEEWENAYHLTTMTGDPVRNKEASYPYVDFVMENVILDPFLTAIRKRRNKKRSHAETR